MKSCVEVRGEVRVWGEVRVRGGVRGRLELMSR